MNGPRKVERKVNEAYIQSKCIDWLRKRHYYCRKFSSPANRSVPDYICSHIAFGKFATEFKAPGKSSTDAQLEEQKLMRLAGWEVWTDVDDIEKFKNMVMDREFCIAVA